MFDEAEEWRQVDNWASYEVSNHGRVRSKDRIVHYRNGGARQHRGVVLRTYSTGKMGYPVVALCEASVQKNAFVHVLVATAFHGPRPSEMMCRHLDGNAQNNHASNLTWGTSSENARDCVEHGNHQGANKERCLRGHLLVHPNLAPPRRPGAVSDRYCLSCLKARQCAARRRRIGDYDFDVSLEASLQYSRIMAVATGLAAPSRYSPRRSKMAQRVNVQLVDDLDGVSSAAETVAFGLDGNAWDIDLSEDNAAALRMILAEYIAVARKAGGVKRPVGARMSKAEAQAIRAWARANDYHPAERGRIPSAVVEAYQASRTVGFAA